MPSVRISKGPVAIVTIDIPERRNALTVQACREVASGIEEAASSSRAVVLTGEGSAFCAGGDFSELSRLSEMDPAEAASHLYSGFQHMIRTIRGVPVPVIAAVNGHAMGAGMDLALACDMRIASSTAQMGQVWVKVGIIPGTGGAFWTTLLAGPGRAAELILLGEPSDAKKALDWGLVNEVVQADVLLTRAMEFGEKIAANPPGAVAANKKVLNDVILAAYEAALENAKETQAVRFASEEFRDSLANRQAQKR